MGFFYDFIRDIHYLCKTMSECWNGIQDRLKICWADARVGSSPTSDTMDKRCPVSLVTFFKDVIVDATTIR